jgi:chromosome partitioning protein
VPAVAFVSPKGGAGKTTAALLLALGLVEQGQRVAMIDSDPNKPLVHWASLPNKPELISVHPAPTVADVPDALREARPRRPDWYILDTEGSLRGAIAFTTMPLDLVITPLAGSALEALQAIKASELLEQFGGRSGRLLPHRCLLTRVPAAIRPRSLKSVIDQLRAREIEMLPTALIEKDAFRCLFDIGGDFAALEREGVTGLEAARQNAAIYVQTVIELVRDLARARARAVAV